MHLNSHINCLLIYLSTLALELHVCFYVVLFLILGAGQMRRILIFLKKSSMENKTWGLCKFEQNLRVDHSRNKTLTHP